MKYDTWLAASLVTAQTSTSGLITDERFISSINKEKVLNRQEMQVQVQIKNLKKE